MDDWEVKREHIKMLEELGKGSFGLVYRGIFSHATKVSLCSHVLSCVINQRMKNLQLQQTLSSHILNSQWKSLALIWYLKLTKILEGLPLLPAFTQSWLQYPKASPNLTIVGPKVSYLALSPLLSIHFLLFLVSYNAQNAWLSTPPIALSMTRLVFYLLKLPTASYSIPNHLNTQANKHFYNFCVFMNKSKSLKST